MKLNWVGIVYGLFFCFVGGILEFKSLTKYNGVGAEILFSMGVIVLVAGLSLIIKLLFLYKKPIKNESN